MNSLLLRSRGSPRECDRYPGSLSRPRLDLDAGLGVLTQGTHDQRSQLAACRPLDAFREADTIIGYNDAATAAVDEAVHGNGAVLTSHKRVFKGVRQQFVDHETGRHRHIH